MNILVTICARAGSKGVKNKNIRLLAGKPLIAHTINQALKWGKTSDVVVSTDSLEIADIAKQNGAQVPFIRPIELAKDESPKLPVIRHALKQSEEINDKRYDCILDLDPTSPIRKIEDIEAAFKEFHNKKPYTLFSVVKAKKNPYFNMVEIDENGFAKLSKNIGSYTRRQDSPKVYDMNGSIYLYQREYLLDENNKSALSSKSIIYVMDDLSAVDIDREIDFKFIEFLIKEWIVLL